MPIPSQRLLTNGAWRDRRLGALLAGSLVGGVALLLSNPNPKGNGFRLELILLPAVATGFAFAAERGAAWLARRRSIDQAAIAPAAGPVP